MNRHTLKISDFLIISTVTLLLSSCTGSIDGDEVDSIVPYPKGTSLTLTCPNEGISTERCVLNNPINPYATLDMYEYDEETQTQSNKWALQEDAPNDLSRYYVWASMMAKSPWGENQYYVADALQKLYQAGSDEDAKNQAIRAYRSVLDNYFNDITILVYGGRENEHNLRDLTGEAVVKSGENGVLYATEADAIAALNAWGYDYHPDETPPSVTKR